MLGQFVDQACNLMDGRASDTEMNYDRSKSYSCAKNFVNGLISEKEGVTTLKRNILNRSSKIPHLEDAGLSFG